MFNNACKNCFVIVTGVNYYYWNNIWSHSVSCCEINVTQLSFILQAFLAFKLGRHVLIIHLKFKIICNKSMSYLIKNCNNLQLRNRKFDRAFKNTNSLSMKFCYFFITFSQRSSSSSNTLSMDLPLKGYRKTKATRREWNQCGSWQNDLPQIRN